MRKINSLFNQKKARNKILLNFKKLAKVFLLILLISGAAEDFFDNMDAKND